jgi:hypothetical protein
MQYRRPGSTPFYRHGERILGELRIKTLAHAPADNRARVQIQDGRQTEKVKRKAINAKYEVFIERMYAD